MSRVDVSDIVIDSDFVAPMKIINRSARTNSRGESVNGENCTDTYGTVQPASGKAISRLPEALRVSNFMSFWVMGKIITTEPGKYTDILVFEGQRFQVVMTTDWTAWGSGWTEGLCVAEALAP